MHFVLHFWGILFYIFGAFHLEKLWQIPVVLIYTRTAEHLFYTKVRLKSVELSQKVQLKSVESPQKVRLKSVIYTILYGNFNISKTNLRRSRCFVQSVECKGGEDSSLYSDWIFPCVLYAERFQATKTAYLQEKIAEFQFSAIFS